jgi:rhamnogalacturonyl hydrolase YesR
MILYSLVEGHRLGIIELEDVKRIQRAWSGLVTQMDETGRVVGVSAGTGPGTYEQYAKIEQGTQPWGTGAFLLAGSALVKR